MHQRILFQAELAIREMRHVAAVFVDHLELPAEAPPDEFDRAAWKWHGRLELEATVLTLAESSSHSPALSRHT